MTEAVSPNGPVSFWVSSDDGTNLAVRRTGSGRPVVLAHPSAGGLESFDPIVPLLDGFELWVYARRGYAPSGGCPRPETFADDVADLRAVLSAVGGAAHVLGASYGSENDGAVDRAEAIGCLHDLEAMAGDNEDAARWAEVAAPTLLMYGTDTWPPMPATMEALADALPSVTRRPLAGQAHFATHTAPGLFAQTVSDYLAGHVDPGGYESETGVQTRVESP